MLRPFPPRPFASKAPATRHGLSQAAIRAEIFYVGVGDQFDDDRRLVRDRSASPHATVQSRGPRRHGGTESR